MYGVTKPSLGTLYLCRMAIVQLATIKSIASGAGATTIISILPVKAKRTMFLATGQMFGNMKGLNTAFKLELALHQTNQSIASGVASLTAIFTQLMAQKKIMLFALGQRCGLTKVSITGFISRANPKQDFPNTCRSRSS